MQLVNVAEVSYVITSSSSITNKAFKPNKHGAKCTASTCQENTMSFDQAEDLLQHSLQRNWEKLTISTTIKTAQAEI